MKLTLKISFLFFLLSTCQTAKKTDNGYFVNTVSGKIPVQKLGFALTHEHIMSNFGAEPKYLPRYDQSVLLDQVVPYLKKVKSLGVSSVFDCTAAYFGRDVGTLKVLSDATGVQIVTNTGYYGAANDRYVPESAYTMSEEEIAQIWIREFEEGIDQTGIRPGFIKLAFDGGEPSDIDLKLFRAGMLTHRRTGLTMVVHTGDNVLASQKQMDLLKQYGLSTSAWVWAHADKTKEVEVLLNAARQGAWISLDGVKEGNIAEYLRQIEAFKDARLLHRLLLSHDGNSFPRGGAIRHYDAIMRYLIPALKERGYSSRTINQLMVENPQRAFGIRVRRE